MKYKKEVRTRFKGYYIGIWEDETRSWNQYYCSGAIDDAGFVWLVLHSKSSHKSKIMDKISYIQPQNIVSLTVFDEGNGEEYVFDEANYKLLMGEANKPDQQN